MSACIVCGAKDAPLAWPNLRLRLCEDCDVKWAGSCEYNRACFVAGARFVSESEDERLARIRSAIMDFVTRVKAEQANARKA